MSRPWPEGPRLRSGLAWHAQPSGLRLLGPEGVWQLPGAHWGPLLESLDGRAADSVVEGLPAPWEEATGYFALAQLQGLGLLEEGEGEARPAFGRLSLHSLGPPEGPLEARLGPWLKGEGPELEVVLAATALDPALGEVQARRAGRAWLLVEVGSSALQAGPLFKGAGGPCWHCLKVRLELNRASGPPPPEVGEAPLDLMWNLLAMEVLRLRRGEASVLADRLWRYAEGRVSLHPVIRLPQCPICGDGNLGRRVEPLRLEPSPKRLRAGGGHRGSPPEEAVARLSRHLSPQTGVISSLHRLTPEEGAPVHVFAASHPFPRTIYSRSDAPRLPWRSLRSSAGGKGINEALAKASAMGECLERFSGIFQGYEPRQTASLEGLGEGGLHPNAVMGFSEAQYAARGTWDPGRSLVHFVPRPFDPEASLEWSALWSLTRRRWRWLPTALCYYGYPQGLDEAMCLADSNGCASGGSLPEAILQGALELVERDGVALWWYNRLSRPAVDLDGVADSLAQTLRDRFKAEGRSLWVLDVTSDLGIPVYAALSRRVGEGNGSLLAGFGAHVDPHVALVRALTELTEVRHQFFEVAPGGGEKLRQESPEAQAWWAALDRDRPAYLEPAGRAALPDPRWDHDDLAEDIEELTALLASHGLELLVLDQTRPGLDLHVVRVVIPGLCHFWRRLGHRRLTEVPVRMGWLERARDEGEMNPLSIFL